MTRFIIGGAAIVAMFAASAAIAQAAHPAPGAQPSKARHGRAMQPLNRATVQARAAAMFARLDANHDGFITKDELGAAAAQRAQKAQQRAAHFNASKLFDGLDVNHDGQVSTDELKAVSAKRKVLVQADTNKDGTISRAEFDAVAQQMKARMEHASAARGGTATRMFEEADANKDGKVTLAEMQQASVAHFDRMDLNHDGTITADERVQARKLSRGKRRSRPSPVKQ